MGILKSFDISLVNWRERSANELMWIVRFFFTEPHPVVTQTMHFLSKRMGHSLCDGGKAYVLDNYYICQKYTGKTLAQNRPKINKITLGSATWIRLNYFIGVKPSWLIRRIIIPKVAIHEVNNPSPPQMVVQRYKTVVEVIFRQTSAHVA